MASQETIDTLKIAQQRGLEVDNLLEEYSMRNETIDLSENSYRNYTQTVNSIDDIRIAPFHILASEGAVHTDKNHEWHMKTIHHLCESDEKLLFPTNYKIQRCSSKIGYSRQTKFFMKIGRSSIKIYLIYT